MTANTTLLPYERIIFPLDFPSIKEAREYVKLLNGYVGVFKVGLELFVSEGPKVFDVIAQETEARVFLDMKFHDIPETVKRAMAAANAHRANFITVHCDEGEKLLKAVTSSADKGTIVLAVTVLTSISNEGLKEMGFVKELQDPLMLVLQRAKMAKKAGCSGVVCSGREASAVKKSCGKDFLVITPGIRPQWDNLLSDDQARVSTPFEAIKNGADYLVVGRPIKNNSNPQEAAQKIAQEIEEALTTL